MLIHPRKTAATRVYGEVPAGVINGINTTYVASQKFADGTEAVFFNGVRQQKGITSDYTTAESVPGLGFDTLVLAVAPRSRTGGKPNDRLTLDYDAA